jgi:hypothetical protein
MRRGCAARIVFAWLLLIGQLFFCCAGVSPVAALDLDSMIKQGLKNQLPGANQSSSGSQATPGNQFVGPSQQAPIKVDRKIQRLEDLVPRQDIPYGFAPMIPLQGITIAGLGPKATLSLGESYFVVRSNTNALRMSELYRDNRLAGRANYVTMDCVVHPYLAFTNRVFAETIRKHLIPIARSLLTAMLKVALSDYKQAEDAEVRADIECNIAFMSLPLKLMDPAFIIPAVGRVPQMVQADYDAVVFARPGRSAIFGRNEDFSFYRPLGWYRSSPDLFTFYRVKTWLSRMYYPINDVTFDSEGTKANNFRRSVLLYRSLDLARIDGKPAMDSWMHLVKGMFLLGSQVENWQEKNLYAHDYKSVFKANSADLKVTLEALSEPLYRTKLLLAVRRQKPVSLGSTSIFDLEEAKVVKDVVAAFKFIPSTGAPEEPWMRYAAGLYPKPQLTTNVFPVALLDLNAWGAPQAANSLLDSSWAMDESMPRTVSELKRWVLRRAIAGQVQPVECRIWSILSPSWRLLPDGIQTVVRGQSWAVRRLETVFAAWLDNLVAIAPLHYTRTSGEGSGAGEQGLQQGATSDDKIQEALANVSAAATTGSGATGAGKTASGKAGLPGTLPLKVGPSSAGSANSGQPGPGIAITTLSTSTVESRSNSQSTIASRSTSSNTVTTGKVSSSAAGKPAGAPRAPGTGLPLPAGSSPPQNKLKPAVARRAARGHFLDPCPDFYNRLVVDAQRIDRELTALGFGLDLNSRRGLDDYQRLFQRLFKIARDELDGKPLLPEDLSLLANIDIILDKIDLPLPAVVDVEPQANFDSAPPANERDPSSGFTMALGRPGLLYVILLNKVTHEWTLARGAVYTYYEQYGRGLNEDSLLGKIDKGTIQPPYWAEQFDYVQADKK